MYRSRVGWYSELPHSTATTFTLLGKAGLRMRWRIKSSRSLLPCAAPIPMTSYLSNAARRALSASAGFGLAPLGFGACISILPSRGRGLLPGSCAELAAPENITRDRSTRKGALFTSLFIGYLLLRSRIHLSQ